MVLPGLDPVPGHYKRKRRRGPPSVPGIIGQKCKSHGRAILEDGAARPRLFEFERALLSMVPEAHCSGPSPWSKASSRAYRTCNWVHTSNAPGQSSVAQVPATGWRRRGPRAVRPKRRPVLPVAASLRLEGLFKSAWRGRILSGLRSSRHALNQRLSALDQNESFPRAILVALRPC